MNKKERIRNFSGNDIPSYEERLKIHVEEKKSIVEKAMLFVHENKKYFFDASTNIKFLLKRLNSKNITAFTNSLDNLEELSKRDDVLINLVGGRLNKENRYFSNLDCASYLKGIEFDAAFLGAAAIMKEGIYYCDEEDALLKQEIAKKSKKVILLAEHQKYMEKRYYKGLNFDEVDIIIIDSMSSNSFINIIESQGILLNPKTIVVM